MKPEITEIFTHWQQIMGHPQAKLIDARKRAIAGRLREGYTVDQIKQAIEGCKASPFHQGENDTGAVYDDLTLICRNGAKLEFFINLLWRRPRRPSLDRFAQNDPEPTAPLPAEPVCSKCKGVGYIDSHPDNPGYVPGRLFNPCTDCDTLLPSDSS